MKKAGSLFTTAYLLLMLAVYPFFMKDGYADLGEAKYQFFIFCALGALAFFAIISGVMGVCRLYFFAQKKEAYLVDWEKISNTDIFVILYATTIYVSYFLSDFRQEALWGTEGWHIGLLPLLCLCALYFFISRMWDGSPFIWYVAMAVSAVVFLLGILDSFSLSIIPISNRAPGFISTMGNINWFCGYLSVLAPVGAGFLVMTEKKTLRWAAGICTFIAFAAGFCQGGSSVFLIFMAVLTFYLWIAVKKRKWLKNWFLMLALWGFSAGAAGFLQKALPGKYNYETNNLCGWFMNSNVVFLIGAAALILYGVLNGVAERFFEFPHYTPKALQDRFCFLRKENRKKPEHYVHKALLTAFGVLMLGWLVLGLIHTRTGMPAFLQKELFTFDYNWGNGRGAAWWTAFHMFGEMSWLHKLFGVGADCFSAYAYSLPELAARLRDWFGAERLTNAHNELLTGLVNTGILGIGFYIGIFGSFLSRCMKKGMQNLTLYMAAACVVSYLVHNMVSFAQVLNLPFVFLVLAMGEKIVRECGENGAAGLDKSAVFTYNQNTAGGLDRNISTRR